MKRLRLQILVVVANIQIRTLKTEVEKGFILTAIGYELVGPKRECTYVYVSFLWRTMISRKGIELIISNLDVDIEW